MTAPSFSYSGNVYTSAAAGSVDFALTSTTGNAIAYLQKAHIHVYKSTNQGATWTELTRPSQWDFTSGGTVARLVTGIASGDWIKVQRITPSTAAYVSFQSSSLLTADQLNDDTLFNTYLNQERYDQGDQSSTVAVAASAAAASATSAATAATATANAASTAAAAATTTANAASASAATALSQSNTAITDSAAALAASANAVTTANTAASNAASAVTTAGTANTNATAAVNTANTAASNASTALSQSTTALTNSATALSTANTAASNASTALTNSSTAVTTANTASTNASNAVTTANTANTNATAALNAVASSLQYVLVANVAAIPSSPANNYAIEVADSTGVESFSPLANRPAGFVGDAGLSVRMQYSTTGPTWNWLNYFPNNAETRYLKLSGGTLTGQLRADDSTSVAAPVIAFDGDTNTGLAHTGADELALVTGGTARLTVDPAGAVAVTNALSVGGQAAVVTNDARLSDTRTPIDGSVTNAKVSATAAIAGTKISPDFGSQNVTTTGTATAASLIPSSSTVPTNGVYLPAANTVAISTNSSERIRIGANGEIGIGGANYGTSGQVLTSAGSGAAPTWQTPAAGNTDKIEEGNSSAEVIDTGSDGRFVVTTEGTERLRVTSSGQLLVGTTTSNGAQLEVNRPQSTTTGLSAVLSSPQFSITNSSNWGFPVGAVFKTPLANGGAIVDNAAIWAEWSDTNSAYLGFATRNSGTIAERVRIDSSGRLLVGTSTARSNIDTPGGNSTPFLQIETVGNSYSNGLSIINNSIGTYAPLITLGATNGGSVGSNTIVSNGQYFGGINFVGADGTNLIEGAFIRGEVDGAPGTNDMPGRLVFGTTADGASSPTERMFITSTGRIGSIRNPDATWPSTVSVSGQNGAAFGTSGTISTSSDSSTCIWVNRNNADGDLIRFYESGTQEGAISVSGTTVTYGGGHLARWSQLLNNEDPSAILKGTVMSNLDEMCEWGDEDNEQLNKTKVSDVEGDPNVAGVFVATSFSDEGSLDFFVGMTGDMIIRIASGVTVERGDLLMSAGDGTAKPQNDDLIRSKTIAKVTSTNVTCTYDDGSYCVPCVLMAC